MEKKRSKMGLSSLSLLICLLFSACQGVTAIQPTSTPEPTVVLTATSTVMPTETTVPTDTPTPSQTPTPEPTPTDPVVSQRDTLLGALDSAEWTSIGMSTARENQWRSFAEGKGKLPEAEKTLVEEFVAQWEVLSPLLEEKPSPSSAKPALRVTEIQDSQGASRVVIYVIDQNTSQEDGSERLFLIAHNKAGKAVGLILSARIAGLEQQPSADGQFVQYHEPHGDWIIRADARWLDPASQRQDTTKEALDEIGAAPLYAKKSMYPRYHFNVPNIQSSFYALENMTYNQILLLRDTLNIYNQGDLMGLAGEVFAAGDEVEYLLTSQPHPYAAAMALPLGGTPRNGIILLFTKNLFHNKYSTAAAIAHEATHVWQGKSPGCDEPKRRLQREVGDKIIPNGFYEWGSAELVKNAKQGKIGAYHVGYWVLLKLKQAREAEWTKRLIQAGSADGQSLINCR